MPYSVGVRSPGSHSLKAWTHGLCGKIFLEAKNKDSKGKLHALMR